MKLLDKIKNALFEESEEEEIAKKVNVEKTVEPKRYKKFEHLEEPEEIEEDKEPEIKAPVIFEDDDFVVERKRPEQQIPTIEEEKPRPYGIKKEELTKKTKSLYGGYEEKSKEKFKPSPIISPVYGLLEKNYKISSNDKTIEYEKDTIIYPEEKIKIDLDSVREKAYGIKEEPKKEIEKEEEPLLYEMNDDTKPGIDKVTIGDAEEYFNDLGLEYNVDYKDNAKEKMTRLNKNKELSEMVEEEIKEDKKISEEIKKKSSRKTKIVEPEQTEDDEITPTEEAEEKNLYDLIDMMYDSKE